MQNNANEVAATTKVEQSPSNFKVILNEFRKDKVAVVSLILAVFIILAAFIGSMMFNVGGATEVNIMDRYMAPGTGGYILGTDEGGRDMFKYLFFAARNSITIGISVALIIE
ncbi:oligopeptide ABC transporter permease, partial [Lacticaseibacillus paracasei subsp. paracasei Lpp126]